METVGAATWTHSLRSLRPGGTLVISGATSGPNPDRRELNRIFFLQLRVVGSTMGTRGELARLVVVPRRHGHQAADRPHPAHERRPATASPRWTAVTSSARSSSPADGDPSGHRGRLRDRYGGRRGPARARRRPGAPRARRRAGSRAAPSVSQGPRRSSPTWPTPMRSTGWLDGRLPARLDSVLHVAGVVELARSPSCRPATCASSSTSTSSHRPCSRAPACPALRAAQGTVVFVNSAAGLAAGASLGGVRRVEVRAAGARRRPCGPRRWATACASRPSSPSRTATPMQRKVHEQEGRTYDSSLWISPETVAATILHVLDVPRDATIPRGHGPPAGALDTALTSRHPGARLAPAVMPRPRLPQRGHSTTKTRSRRPVIRGWYFR